MNNSFATSSTMPVFVGPFVLSRRTRPCPTYFELSFLGNNGSTKQQVSESARTRLGAIIFRNYYCSHITIKQRWESNGNIGAAATCGGIGGTVESDPWVTVLRDRALMTDPHFEDDAQDWHVITVEEFDQGKYDADSTAQLRIYLYQPSPMWKTIALQHVKCVSWSELVDGRGNVRDSGEFGRGIGEGASELLPMCVDSSRIPVIAPHHRESHLDELCRGIGEQVNIFGGNSRTGRRR